MKVIYFALFLSLSSLLFASKIPKPEVRAFDTLKINDMTKRIQINTSLGGEIWLWNNLNESSFTFKTDELSLGLDAYFYFYNAISIDLKHQFDDPMTILSIGYKLSLYDFLYTKLQLENVLYPSWNLGLGLSVGVEFTSLNLLRLFTYTTISSFIFNTKNLTTIRLSYNLGIGLYF